MSALRVLCVENHPEYVGAPRYMLEEQATRSRQRLLAGVSGF